MNWRLLIAAFLATFTTLVHIFLGGASVVTPLLQSTLADELRLTLFAAWQVTCITFALSALAFFIGSLPRHAQAARYLVIFISILWLGCAGCFIAVALSQPESGGLFKMQQWTLLIPVGLMGLWGAKAPRDH